MRKFTLFLFLGGFFCIHSYAQWIAQTAPVTFEARGVHMTSSQVGYIVGSSGNMLMTSNAGSSWSVLPTGTTDTLRSLYFINQFTGFIVGAQGTIRRTDDGGLSWTAQTSGVTNLLRSVWFVNDTTGYVCGGGGVILKTINGGNSWVPQTSGITSDLINIRFSGENTGYAVSSLSTFTNGTVLKTSNGGNTWTSVYTNTNGLLGLAVIGDVIYAGGGYETIVKSSDAGNTWTQVNPASATANNYRSAAFFSANEGYVVGDVGLIYFTNDGGTTWTNQGINTLGVLSIFIVNQDTVFACGTSSNILRYIDCPVPAQPSGITGSLATCAYDTVTFSISPVQGATSYTWQVPATATILSIQGDTLITVMLGTAGGVVTVSASNNCGSGGQAQLILTVNQNPLVPVITQNVNVLHSSAPAFNHWYLNGAPINGATAQTYVFTQNGVYRVKVTLPTGCWSISAPFTVLNTGIDVVQTKKTQPAVFPNPVYQTANLNLQLTETSTVEAAVFDMIGNKVLNLAPIRRQSGQHQIALDCMSFSKGIYFVKMLINDNVYFIKFLKE
ncbi:MAG: YCF48-related protein [Bacteroidetes bacterium]|nr:YCF48-related protein [Bacteroidota bacterium]